MTDTKCPSCQVLLDLPKYATGHCEWCGCELPADHVRHARERVTLKTSARKKFLEDQQHRPGTDDSSGRNFGIAYLSGIGLILVMLGYFVVAGVREGKLSFDTTMAGMCLIALVFAGVAFFQQWFPRGRSRPVR